MKPLELCLQDEGYTKSQIRSKLGLVGQKINFRQRVGNPPNDALPIKVTSKLNFVVGHRSCYYETGFVMQFQNIDILESVWYCD